MSEFKLYLKTKTWKKNILDNKGFEKGLFDFETNEINIDEFCIHKSTILTRVSNNVQEENIDKFEKEIINGVFLSKVEFTNSKLLNY